MLLAAFLACGPSATPTRPAVVSCPASTTRGCTQLCQLVADCVVENGTAAATAEMGFGTTGSCGSCVQKCQSNPSWNDADRAVFACFETKGPATICGPGQGKAAFDTAGECCKGRSGSSLCASYCEIFGRVEKLRPLPGCP